MLLVMLKKVLIGKPTDVTVKYNSEARSGDKTTEIFLSAAVLFDCYQPVLPFS